MTQRRRKRKKKQNFSEVCYDWAMVLMIAGAMISWATLPPDIGEEVGFIFLASALLFGLSQHFRPKPRRSRR